jgi:hypothetical protein
MSFHSMVGLHQRIWEMSVRLSQQSIPFFIAIAPKGMALHSIESAKADASPQAYEATVNAAKALGMTTIDFFSDLELAKRIKKEFAQAKTRARVG